MLAHPSPHPLGLHAVHKLLRAQEVVHQVARAIGESSAAQVACVAGWQRTFSTLPIAHRFDPPKRD